ncbi:MAG TPA: DEAD/DEAH box helicase, partial [Thermoanaerobaculia bacterium]|nr:DEAD/DEAH box helicase [Thermoanaerobaculia bacterium]
MTLTSDLQPFIERLLTDSSLAGSVRASIDLPAEQARFADLDPPLAAPIADALAERGVNRLWTHQVEAISALRRGDDVLVTTPTASGKSLIYQVPVLEEAARGGASRALFLFPLKALGNDQRTKLADLAAASGLGEEASLAIYDGDTPPYQRQRIKRKPPRVLISNPDMLHLGILPYWHSWAPFLGEL